MGTTIRTYGLDEAAARGERFADNKKDLLNNGDILSLTRYIAQFADAGLLNFAGGCCGNTPEHVAAIARAVEGKAPRRLDQRKAS